MTPRKYKNSNKSPSPLRPSLSPPPSPPFTSRTPRKDGPSLSKIHEALENLDSVCDKKIQQKKEVATQLPPTENSQQCLPVSNHCIVQ